MTALKQYQRLEAAGLWRSSPQEQNRNVVVSLGDASLTITDTSDRVLAHWSLGAVARANKGQRPALYHPDGDPGETLELDDDAVDMIDAIEKVRAAISRGRAHPGKLRFWLTGLTALLIAALVVLWLPDALVRHTVRVVPDVKRVEISNAVLNRITRISGPPCKLPEAQLPLARLSNRLFGAGTSSAIVVLREGVRSTAHLPDGRVLINRTLIEGPDDPEITAGFITVERLRALQSDPLHSMLEQIGFWSSLRLLTTGSLQDTDFQSRAEHILSSTPAALPDETILAGFDAIQLRSTPYAYAIDPTGESTLALIEADPHKSHGSRLVLADADWIRLQGICGG